jgi:hypothetical protein
MNDPRMTLHNLYSCYLELKNGSVTGGNPNDISTVSRMGFDSPGTFAALRDQLLLFAVPRLLGLPETQDAKPGETLPVYLLRLANTARETSDWGLLERLLERSQQVNAGAVFTPEDRAELPHFLAGINQERARQYALAVGSFEAALKTGSQIISPEVIGDHLDSIRKEHPQEFAEGALRK